MKKILFANLAGTFLALAVTATPFAQNSNFPIKPDFKNPIPEFRENSHSDRITTDPVVNSKVLNAFALTFRNVADATWYEVDQKFLARFNKDGRESSALFNPKGMLLYTIAYGTEKHLPNDVRKLVRTNYFDHEMIYTAEVNSLGKTAWVIKLQDPTSLIVVKVVDGEMEETEHFRRFK
jgi:hypothetical protein